MFKKCKPITIIYYKKEIKEKPKKINFNNLNKLYKVYKKN
jgi:hypothetical protein